MGRIFEIREFTLHDGPGPRMTVFMQGCPLRCPWCHNPEGLPFSGGREADARDIVSEIAASSDFLLSSGGGVTFSGGEPLSQAEFLLEVIGLLREKIPGIHIAVETSGFASAGEYRAVVSKTDLVFQDVKFPDAGGYLRWTGVEASRVFDNIAYLKTSGVPFIVRIPCIPGVNDTLEVKTAVARLLEGSSSLVGVELLPYNRLAGAKYAKLGLSYNPGFDVDKPSDLSGKEIFGGLTRNGSI